MAVSYVRVTEGNSVNTTLTLNIQSSGSDRVFIFGVSYKSNSVLTPTSLVFNGTENFTLERSAIDGGDAQCLLYRLTAPSLTTADVVLTMPGAVRMMGYVALFNGVHQTTPFTANTSEAQGTNNAPTVDVSSAADEMCIDILVQVSAGPDTATATHTQICNGAATGGGTDTRGAGQYAVGQATRTMNWTMSDADNWNIIAGALQEPAGITHSLSGSAGGTSSVSVAPVKVKKEISGDASGTSTADAIFSALMELVSSAGGTSGATASLIKLRKLIGSAGGTSTADAILSVFAVVGLIGSAGSTSGSTALIKSLKEFIGSAGETSGATALLKSLKELVTSAGGISDATGNLKALKELISSVSSTSGATGLMKAGKGVSASVDSSSSALAILTLIGEAVTLSGDAEGISSATGILSALKELVGSASSTSGLTGIMRKLKGFISSAQGTSSATADVKRLRSLLAQASGISMITGDTSILKSLISSVDATSGVTGNLTVEVIVITPKLITGVMSESLHIKGIMSKEFSAIRCLDFNGSTDYVDCGHDSSLDIIDTFTLEVWIKPVTVTVKSTIISKGQTANYKSYFLVIGEVSGKISLHFYGDAWNSDASISANEWIQIVTTIEPSGSDTLRKIYTDGVFRDDDTCGNLTDISGDFGIGKDIVNVASYFKGKGGIIRKWNRILSPEEIINSYNGNAPRNGLVAEWLMREQQGNIIHDTSVNSNHGTIYGADWYEEKFNTPLKGIMSNSSAIKGIMTAEYI